MNIYKCRVKATATGFYNKFLNISANVWPRHSPDLNPLDFFLWGYPNDKVNSSSPQKAEDPKTATTQERRSISVDTCKVVIKKSCNKNRVLTMLTANGHNLEHMLQNNICCSTDIF